VSRTKKYRNNNRRYIALPGGHKREVNSQEFSEALERACRISANDPHVAQLRDGWNLIVASDGLRYVEAPRLPRSPRSNHDVVFENWLFSGPFGVGDSATKTGGKMNVSESDLRSRRNQHIRDLRPMVGKVEIEKMPDGVEVETHPDGPVLYR